jgi:hypothetical protein
MTAVKLPAAVFAALCLLALEPWTEPAEARRPGPTAVASAVGSGPAPVWPEAAADPFGAPFPSFSPPETDVAAAPVGSWPQAGGGAAGGLEGPPGRWEFAQGSGKKRGKAGRGGGGSGRETPRGRGAAGDPASRERERELRQREREAEELLRELYENNDDIQIMRDASTTG